MSTGWLPIRLVASSRLGVFLQQCPNVPMQGAGKVSPPAKFHETNVVYTRTQSGRNSTYDSLLDTYDHKAQCHSRHKSVQGDPFDEGTKEKPRRDHNLICHVCTIETTSTPKLSQAKPFFKKLHPFTYAFRQHFHSWSNHPLLVRN
jgi:hypothetical protein